MNHAEAGRLLARYLEDELPADERRQLMDTILSDQDLYNAFAEELLLAEALKDPGFRAKVNAAVQPASGGIARLAAFLGNLNTGWRLAGAALAAALALMSVVLIRTNRNTPETVAQGGRPAAATYPKTTREATPAPAVLTLLLAPGVRDAGGAKNTIEPAGLETLRLAMSPGEGSYVSYRAVLQTADLRFRREFEGLKPQGSGGGRQLVLEIPPGLLQAGDYTVQIFGLTPAGTAEPAAGYSFSVMPKK